MKYEVQVNGETVWEGDGPGETDDDDEVTGKFDRGVFPAEYLKRPEKGSLDVVVLITGDEVRATNRAEDHPWYAEQAALAAQAPPVVITGVGGAVQDTNVGKGG